jgi:acetylornithine deacetylase/succinyl-diaminopimelate desuccinylase-like protein
MSSPGASVSSLGTTCQLIHLSNMSPSLAGHGSEDPITLTQQLTQIESTNPTLSASGGTGESAIAAFIEAWLKQRGIECHKLEAQPGRPSLVGIVRGTGGGKSLMINGHIDTVSLAEYARNPLDGTIEDRNGKPCVTGRGALDMKAGLAAGMAVLAEAKLNPPRGDILLAAVADEEHLSKGTEEVLAAGWRADGAVVTEPTGLQLGTAHKGFVWIEVTTLGVAAHGSMPDKGVDAIAAMGRVMASLQDYAANLPTDPMLGKASLHCGLIKGGEESSSYPANCTLTIELRTIPVQTTAEILDDFERMLKTLASEDAAFRYAKPRVTFERAPHSIAAEHELAVQARAAAENVLGREVAPQSVFGWCDAALLSQAGVAALVFGPEGEGLHGKDEWVTVDSIRQTTEVLRFLVDSFCN